MTKVYHVPASHNANVPKAIIQSTLSTADRQMIISGFQCFQRLVPNT